MKMTAKLNQEKIQILQHEAEQFLTKTKLILKGTVIIPKEIEIYYYKEEEFEDTSVHRNELQTKKNQYHFYVHRYGLTKLDKFKGGNRVALDFVVSADDNVFYSYLIRSAVINDKLIVGSNKVLRNILESSKLSVNDVESEKLEMPSAKNDGEVLFSTRVNLGKNAGLFEKYNLRAVLCDFCFRNSKYPAKEQMIIDYLSSQFYSHNMNEMQIQKYAKDNLGYVPSALRMLR